MVGYGPRVYGYRPGRPISSKGVLAMSSGVYTRSVAMPDAVRQSARVSGCFSRNSRNSRSPQSSQAASIRFNASGSNMTRRPLPARCSRQQGARTAVWRQFVPGHALHIMNNRVVITIEWPERFRHQRLRQPDDAGLGDPPFSNVYLSAGMHMLEVACDLIEQSCDAFVTRRDARHERRLPRVTFTSTHRQHHAQLRDRALRPLTVRLVDGVNIGDLDNARFQRLNVVSEAGHTDYDGGMRNAHDVNFVLPYPYGLYHHELTAGGAEHIDGVRRRSAQAAQRAARCHASDEHARVAGDFVHADAIA